VDRRRRALVALVAFAVATAVSIVVSGARPVTGQGVAPYVVQGAADLFALAAGVLLLLPADRSAGADRKLGGAVLAAVAVLVVLDAEAFAGAMGGPDIGAGVARLACLLVLVAVAGRLLATSRTAGGRRP
jgi:hypothetical protein